MKNLRNIAFCIACLSAVVACSDKDVDGNEQKAVEDKMVTVTFQAGFEDDNTTRTAFVDAGDATHTQYVAWQSADKVNVFNNASSAASTQFTLQSGAGSKYGVFTGDLPYSQASTATEFSSLTPYQETAAYGTNINTIAMATVPTVQTAAEGTYDPDAALLMARTNTTEKYFHFKNVCHFIKVTPECDCQYITIESTDPNRYLTGSVNVIYDGDTTRWVAPSVSSAETPMSHKARLIGNINAGKTYYIAVLPGAINGTAYPLKITYGTCEKYRTVSYKKDIWLLRSYYTDLSAALADITQDGVGSAQFVDLGLPSGTKWATHNLGGRSATDIGNFYAWGEIAGLGETDFDNAVNIENYHTPTKTIFNWVSYKYGDGNAGGDDGNIVAGYHMKKYTGKIYTVDESGNESNDDVSGWKSQLENSDDAAYMNGFCGYIPTKDQFEELLQNCYWVYNSTNHGFIVYKVESGDEAYKGWLKTTYDNGSTYVWKDLTGANRTAPTTDPATKSTSYIFLPFTGYYGNNSTYQNSDSGYYWSRDVSQVADWKSNTTCYYEKAYDLLLANAVDAADGTKHQPMIHTDNRRGGQSIRPVDKVWNKTTTTSN